MKYHENSAEDYYGSYKRLDYYTNYYDNNKISEEKEEKPQPLILEERSGMIKVYNRHIGTFVWEKAGDKDGEDS